MRAFGGIALLFLLLGLHGGNAEAKPVAGRRFGVGLVVGEPTAVTGYFSLHESFAVDAALGLVSPGQRDLAGQTDILAVLGPRAQSAVTAALTIGAGLWFNRFYGKLFGGVRLPLGAALHVPRARLAVYAEVAVELLLWQPYDTPRSEEFQAALGIRFFF